MSIINHACSCGAVYKLTSHNISTRDKDSKECQFCGETLIDWNGGVMWTAELIEHPGDGQRG